MPVLSPSNPPMYPSNNFHTPFCSPVGESFHGQSSTSVTSFQKVPRPYPEFLAKGCVPLWGMGFGSPFIYYG